MATRRVTTRVAVEGEAEYREKVARINSDLRTLDSTLKLVSSQYQDNANSLEALTAKSVALADKQAALRDKETELILAYNNAQDAVDTYTDRQQELTAKIDENEAALAKLKDTQGDTTEEEKRLTEETARLRDELENNNARLEAAERGVNDWERQLNNAQIQLEDTNREIKANDQYLEEARQSTDQCATSIDEFGDKVEESNDSLSELNGLLASAGIIAGLKKLADMFIACSEASIEFESGMTGVAKTTDLSGQELADMGEELKRLSTQIPQTTTELAAIAENAGQLGIQKEHIVSFTRVMADLGVATNLTGEEAAQMFAKFANITQMDQGDFDRLGAAVVDLGNNLATTESDIASMALRLAAAGTQAGMTQGEILGLSGALSSVGMEAQAGGSAFSKAINMMTVAVETGSDSLTDFATVAGMSAEEFARAYREDAAGALIAFIGGLGDIDTHGKSAVLLLEELGLTEIRLRDSLTRAANASELFADSVARGNEAWAENTALTTEAELRYGTTESKLQMLGNAMNNVQISVGDQLNPALNVLVDIGTDLLIWLDGFISESDYVVPILTGVSVALGTLAVGLTTYTVIMPLATKVTTAFTAALSTNPIFAVVAAVAGLSAGIAILVASMDDGTVKAKDLTTASRAAAEAFESIDESAQKNAKSVEATVIAAQRYCDSLDALNQKAQETGLSNAEMEIYKNIVAELNELVPDLNLTLDEQTGLLDSDTDAVRRNIDAWRDQAILQGQMEALTAKYSELGAVQLELAENTLLATQAQQDYDTAAQTHGDTLARMNELMELASDEALKLSSEWERTVDPLEVVSAEYFDLEASLGELTDTLYWAEAQLNETNEAVAISEDALAALTAEVEVSEAALGMLGGAMEDATDTTREWMDAEYQLQDVLESSIYQMDALKEAYNEAFEAARDSIEKQIGLFDEFDHEVTLSTTNMVETWNKQAENVRNYNENLAFSSKYLSAGLIEAWSDGSTESAGHVEAFSGTLRGLIEQHGEESEEVQTFVEDFNAAYLDTRVARDEFAEVVATMSTNFNTSMDSIQTKLDETVAAMNASEQAAAAANETINGLINTFDSRMGELYERGVQAGEEFMKGYNSRMKIHSPSREAAQAADYTMDGFENRFEKGIDELNEMGQQLGEALVQGYEAVQQSETLAAGPLYEANTYHNGGNISNRAEFHIAVQSMSEAEVQRLLRIADAHFGGRTNMDAVAGGGG